MLLNIIPGHIVVILGSYLFARGIHVLLGKPATPAHIFKNQIFWGLFIIMGGLCAFFVPLLMSSY